MKVTIVLVALFAISSGSPIQREESNPLVRVLLEFIALLPQEIPDLIKEYSENDPEAIEAFAFLSSDGHKQYIMAIENIPEFQVLLKYVQNHGVDVYYIYQKIHEFVGLPPFVPPRSLRRPLKLKGKGMEGMYTEIEALLPLDKIKALHDEKMVTSPEYKALLELLHSEKFMELNEAAADTEEYLAAVAIPNAHHVDFNRNYEVTAKIFGFDL